MFPTANLQSQQRTRRPTDSRKKAKQSATRHTSLERENNIEGDPVSGSETRHPRKLSPEEREEVRNAIQLQLGNSKIPREFQVEMVVAQEEMRDAMCHAATGLGKTLIAAAPFALERNRDKVTIMVSPLIALQNEMVETFKHEYGVSAVAINSSHGPGSCSFEVMEDIVSGKYNIVLISPEKLLTEKFIDNVLKKEEFEKRVYTLFVDEAHCVSHWGADFRKAYGRLGVIRAFLPQNTPVVAVSASLTARVAKNIRTVLQFRSDHVFINIGNNRRNVSLVVRSIHNKADSYTDLDFIIPPNVTNRAEIKKAWIYADNIHDGADIVDHIRELLPPDMRDVVRPYNAMFGIEYRAKAMQEFREGHVRILVCTDAAGMGCNIPDIEVVVQWKLPNKFSSFVQRAGRAARGEGRTGVAVLLAEPSAFSVDTSQEASIESEKQSTQVASRGRKSLSSMKTKQPKKARLPKEFAELHGRYRGQRNGARDDLPQLLVNDVHIQDENEGMHAFVQTVTCRRKIQQLVFDNPDVGELLVDCCDICSPSLLDIARPGIGPKATRNPKLPDAEPHAGLVASLLRWREVIRARDFADNMFLAGSSILPTEAVSLLASLDSFTKKVVEGHLSRRWHYWETYGEELCEHLYVANEECRLADTSKDTSPHSPVGCTETSPISGEHETTESNDGEGRDDSASTNQGTDGSTRTRLNSGVPTVAGDANIQVERPSKRQKVLPTSSTSAEKSASASATSAQAGRSRVSSKGKRKDNRRSRTTSANTTDTTAPVNVQADSSQSAIPSTTVTGFQMVSAQSIVQSGYENPLLDTVGAVPHLHTQLPTVPMHPNPGPSHYPYGRTTANFAPPPMQDPYSGFRGFDIPTHEAPPPHYSHSTFESGYATSIPYLQSWEATANGQNNQNMYLNSAPFAPTRSTSFRGFRTYEGPKD